MTHDMVFTFLEGVAGGGMFVLAHSNKPPSNAEWDSYMKELGKHDPKWVKSLAFTDGGAPTGPQRKLLNDLLNGRQCRAAVVTSDAFVRGVVTALSWFNSYVKAFSPDELDEALRYLEVRERYMALVRHEIQILRKRLGYDGLKSIVAT